MKSLRRSAQKTSAKGKRKKRGSKRAQAKVVNKRTSAQAKRASAKGNKARAAPRKRKVVVCRVAPTPPSTKLTTMSEGDKTLLNTFNRKDDEGRMMAPPSGSARIIKQVILLLHQSYDEYVLSESARKQLVFLRIKSMPSERLKLHAAFPPKKDFRGLLKRLPDQHDSGGSDTAHWMVYNLTTLPSKQLAAREDLFVGSPGWQKVKEELAAPPHWYQYIMTLVVLARYDYVKQTFLSSFTDDDVQELQEQYSKYLDREEARIKCMEVVEGSEKEVKAAQKEITALRYNITNAKRLTQK